MNEYIKTSLPSACGIAAFPPGATLGPRTLSHYEFIWVLDGVAAIEHDGVTSEAAQHAVILLRPGFAHRVLWDAWQNSRHAFIQFEVRDLPSEMPPPDEWPLLRAPVDGDILRPQFKYLLNWYGRGRPELTRLTLQHMLAAFITGEAAIERSEIKSEPSTVDKALAFIHLRMEQDPAIPVHLRQLAKAASVTPEHLCRAFKTVTGRSPAETVRLARLDRAAQLLTRSGLSIQRVARLCGFASPFHFSRRFTDAFGQSPRRFRQKIAAGKPPPQPLLARARKSAREDEASVHRALYLKFLSAEKSS